MIDMFHLKYKKINLISEMNILQYDLVKIAMQLRIPRVIR